MSTDSKKLIGAGDDFIPIENERPMKSKKKNFPRGNLKELREKRRQKRARIIVRNISYKATDDSFREYFEKFGKINDLQLLKKGNGKLVGCGFIQFDKVNQAAKAILKSNKSEFLGRPVIVDWALGKNEYEKRKKPNIKDKIKLEENVQSNEIKENVLQKIKEESSDESNESSLSENCSDEELLENTESDEESEENASSEETEDSESNKEKFAKNSDEDDSMNEDENKKSKKDVAGLEISKQKFKSNDVKEECTVFIKNVPFDCSNDDLRKVCRKFGPVYYVLINSHSVSGHSRGTAFVKFKTKESADLCLRSGDEFVVMDQVLEALPALSKEDIQNKGAKNDKHKDSRNLYLIKEGLIMTGSNAADGVTASDMAKRHKIEQVKAQVLKNLNRFVSRNRLSIHNLPLSYDDEKLKTTIMKHTQLKPHECRVMRENKPSIGNPKGKSKGFGFMSFKSHNEALIALRKLNNNPGVFGAQNRPIVGFSIEDRSVHNIKQKRLEKSRQNNPLYMEKLKGKKLKRLQKDNKVDLRQKIRQNQSKLNNTNKNKNQNHNINEDKFMGMPAKPGTFVRMRSVKKIREQSREHKKKLGELKRKTKMVKEKKELRIEKKLIDRPINKTKKIQDKDNFSLLINKYKNLIDSKLNNSTKKSKRTKWYSE